MNSSHRTPRRALVKEGIAMSRWDRTLVSASIVALASITVYGSMVAKSKAASVTQGPQSDGAYAVSFAANNVTNVFATTQQTSCYRPEVPYFVNNGPSNGYSGMS